MLAHKAEDEGEFIANYVLEVIHTCGKWFERRCLILTSPAGSYIGPKKKNALFIVEMHLATQS